MSKAVYDTRFFIEHYYAKDEKILQKTKEELRKTKQRYISAIVLHEIYQLTLGKEGRETAVLRTTLLEKDFRIVDVDAEIAKRSAELRHKYRTSMADSIIAATSLSLNAICFSDDPHLKGIKEIKTKWI
ncbi:MAG: PIN domain-containing protein [Candidatus Bathyarchaeia archaeon]|jgi:predicted nucleic acid-binding protein|nr:PIN domain-containing protein [Candidatus Bathyarchaeota archaeon A05DMB-4]MDH7594710.1 PIN domain-containing protein [Candidatus Bathyarchaeota archaeon]